MAAKRRSRGRPQVPEITEAQRKTLRELRDFIASRKYPPTMSELGDRLGVALGVEGGWTLHGVFGDAGGTRVGLERGWLGADLRLDWRFGEG